MRRISRYPLFAVCAVVLAVGLGVATPSLASAGGSGPGACPTTARTLNGTLPDGATYEIQVPANWNCTLFLYSHGYVAPGEANPAQDVGDPITGGWMLSHGYALAGSSYATTGWAIQQALPDQIATLNVFDQQVGAPARTIAWGHSLGGIITAGLIQDYPNRFTAALPMCGVLSGGVATWNTALDSEVAIQQLIDPSLQVVNITNPDENLAAAEQAVATAQQTPQGQARIALAAALGDTPGWFTPLSPQPAANDYATQEYNQYLWDIEVDFPFAFALRAELEARAGGNVSWTTGVNFVAQLANSPNLREVLALYQAAGLSLRADLATLGHATRISAVPAAVRYLAKYISFNGQLSMPVLTMHTTGDGLVIPENEQAYASVVRQAGDSQLLRQIFVSRAGHCAFTPAETITAVQTLLNRLATGHWNGQALQPANLNANASGLGPEYNVFTSNDSLVATPPAFVSYRPYPYPRPFDLNAWAGPGAG
jgi:pimeloyl-ACP methyl ester carboxylesterase